MKNVIQITLFCLTMGLAMDAQSKVYTDRMYAELLAKYVHNGVVNYRSLKSDSALYRFVHSLENVNPDSLPNESSRLAFWLNDYNANTLKLICEHYPIKSINDIHDSINGRPSHRTPWEKPFIVSLGNRMSLNNVEEYFVRMRFHDPRAHFALVCASRSCPPLRTEPYHGENLNAQLDEQARLFLNDTSKNVFDVSHRTATLSKIFDWYSKDFGGTNESILRFVAKFLPSPLAQDILGNLSAWKITYKNYDWSLNSE